jgi:hypothetical protein
MFMILFTSILAICFQSYMKFRKMKPAISMKICLSKPLSKPTAPRQQKPGTAARRPAKYVMIVAELMKMKGTAA